jgi:hypothetical protein
VTQTISDAELARLRAAERLAVVYGWCAITRTTPAEQVAYDLWKEWIALAGTSDYGGPRQHPDLDALVREAEAAVR